MPAGDPISGKDGTIKTGVTPVAIYQILNWKINTTASVDKFGVNSSAWKRAVAGKPEWSGSFDAKLDDSNAIPVTKGQTVAAQFHADGSDGEYLSGNIVIESVEIETDIDSGNAIGYSVTFHGDGDLTATGTMLAV